MKTKLIGREKEIAELQRCLQSDRSEFVIVYGRRRVGKTFLVDEFFHRKYDFSFVGGHNLSQAKQLRNFAKAIKTYAGLSKRPKYADWSEAFDQLEELLSSLQEDHKKVVFIDEMPWIDTAQSDFVEELENFWNGWAARRQDILFIASGSATSWMMDKLVENQGGLHCRITSNIYLRPFNLHEMQLYLQSKHCAWDHYQIVQTYMILGGIPFYLSLLDTKTSLVQNIDRLFFQRNAVLKLEFDELYNALFKNADKYIQLVQLLAKHKEGLTRKQIGQGMALEGKMLTQVIKNLERCDFILRYGQYGHKVKDAIYRLSDFYTLFFYQFVVNNTSQDEQWWSHNFSSHGVESWQGLTFELVCMMHTDAIKHKLGISGVSTSVSSWRYIPSENSEGKGAQIDMLIERSDRTINVCEMKFSIGKYVLSENYANLLRNRLTLFQTKEKITYALIQTMVTTFGISEGTNSSIVQAEITMEDLFKENN